MLQEIKSFSKILRQYIHTNHTTKISCTIAPKCKGHSSHQFIRKWKYSDNLQNYFSSIVYLVDCRLTHPHLRVGSLAIDSKSSSYCSLVDIIRTIPPNYLNSQTKKKRQVSKNIVMRNTCRSQTLAAYHMFLWLSHLCADVDECVRLWNIVPLCCNKERTNENHVMRFYFWRHRLNEKPVVTNFRVYFRVFCGGLRKLTHSLLGI